MVTNNLDVVEKVNAFRDKPNEVLCLNSFKQNLVNDQESATMIISSTNFFKIEDFRFIFIKAIENERMWIIKLKEKDGVIIANEITLIVN